MRLVFLLLPTLALGSDIGDSVKSFLESSPGTSEVPEELSFLPELWDHGQVSRVSPEEKDLACDACEAAVQVVIDLMLLGVDESGIEDALSNLCALLGIVEASVCDGGVATYGPGLRWIVENSEPPIGGRQVCGAIIGKGCGAWEEINDWTVELPSDPKPPVEEPMLPPEGSPSKKILHLTDVHIDLSYMEGAEAACGLPMCCMNTSGLAASEETAAGYWGDYRCDVPMWTIQNMLENIRDQHGSEIDYIMITGDFPPHDVWKQSRDSNLMSSRTFLDLVKAAFPDTQIFPSIGNHEPYPCNILPGSTSGVEGSEHSPGWLLDELSEYYSTWLPQEQLEMFRQTAAYSFQPPDRPGFRILSIPSPLCLNYNFFIFMDFSDPGNMLAWMTSELLKAEQAGERVHILSHVPAGNHECLGGWGREYAKIINRFENTVVAQFHGHTHNDHFEVFYDETGTRASNIAFITPSVSTYTWLNPGYRLYTIDAGHEAESYRVLDTETFILDLGTANSAGSAQDPLWFKLYSGREDLELDSMFPGDMDNLVRRLANEVEFYKKWLSYYNKGSVVPDSSIEKERKWDILCGLLTTSNLDKSKCDEIIGPE